MWCSLLHINVLLRKPICADALYEAHQAGGHLYQSGRHGGAAAGPDLRELGVRSRRSAISVHC